MATGCNHRGDAHDRSSAATDLSVAARDGQDGIPRVTTTRSVVGALRVAAVTLRYYTARGPQFIDITDDVRHAVAQSGIADGVVTVYSKHTTAAIKINEHEPFLLEDMERFVCALSPQERTYNHNNFLIRVVNMEEDECPNGHAHCQHLLLNTSEQIPLQGGQLQLGRWQRVFLVELDHARPREVVVQVMGC
ncbi:MAG: secondary thiamine-phosphate synthase enzyme [Chloroflexota bacterium]